MNAVDFICLIPFFISLLLEGLEDVEIVGKAGKMIRFLKILRIFRVYKMFKHFAGLQSLLYTLQQAYRELGLLLHILLVAILTFSSLMYVCQTEFSEDVPITWQNRTFYVETNDTWTFAECVWWDDTRVPWTCTLTSFQLGTDDDNHCRL